MINKNTILKINEEIDNGNHFFYFDKRSMKLVSSSPTNDIVVYDCHELHIPEHINSEDTIIKLLIFYNSIN